MLMIRFQRIGRKNDASFRIAVLEKTSGPKAGKYVDLVGTYNPKTKVATLKQEAIKGWMSKGAQVSPSVHNLLVSQGVIEGTKTAKVVSKTNLEKNVAKRKAEEEAAAAKVAEEAKAAEEAAATPAPEPAVEEAPAEDATVEEVPAETVEEAPVAEEAPAEEVAA
jgi:small subunit ribosomal protein S16